MNILRRLSILIFLFAFFDPARLTANPVGEVVRAGNATFNRVGQGALTINQTTDRVIIDWNSFSIGAGQITRFNQPSISSAALNRVLSGNPSQIFGTLQANGQVFLLNPNGILVGAGGQINTHSFIGSTLNVSDQSFLSGVGMRFAGSSTASVKNEGAIQALGGDVFLFAHTVENSGAIRAPSGTVGLAAGSEVILQQAGNERVGVLAGNLNVPQTAKGVNNVGAIEAAAAELKAAGGNIYALAVNNGGIIRANSIVHENGRIVLRARGGNIANSGTLSARNANGDGGSVIIDGGHKTDGTHSVVINSGTIDARGVVDGAKGGEVKVLGDRVGLTGNAVVDVSGHAGGGTALIGGDYQGKNPDVQNAERTYVGPDAIVRSDATGLGDGGKVILWADQFTVFLGRVSARGGRSGGNGGFVEISGKQSLAYRGSTDLRAPLGHSGSLLLDPANLTVSAATTDDTQLDDGVINAADSPALDFTISAGKVQSELALGNVSLAASVSLTINAGITASGGGDNDLSLTAPTISLNQPIDLGSHMLSLNTGPAPTAVGITGSGLITAGTLTLNGAGNVGTSLAPLNTKIALLALSKSGGNTFISEFDDVSVQGSTVGNLDLAVGATKTITVPNPGAGVDLSSSAGSITLSADEMNLTGTLSAQNVTLKPKTAATAISLDNGATGLDFTDADLDRITIAPSSGVLQIGSATAGNITVGNGLSQSKSLSLVSGADVTLNDSVSISGAGNSFSSSGVNFTGSDGAGPLSPGTITTAGGNVTLNFSGDLAIGAAIAAGSGNIDITSRTIALNANLSGSGTLSLKPKNVASATESKIGLGLVATTDPLNIFGLDGVELSKIQDGFSQIRIGDPAALGDVTVHGTALTFNDPILIQTAGAIIVNNTALPVAPGIHGADDASVQLIGGTITLNADIVTDGNAITLNGPVVLGTPASIALGTTGLPPAIPTDPLLFPNGAAININGTVNDDSVAPSSALVLDGGSTGATLLGGAVGDSKPITSLTTDAGGVTTLNGEVNADVQTYNDDVVLKADSILRKDALTAATTVHFGGKVNSSGDGATTSDNHNLTVNAVTTDFDGAVGGNADGKLGTLITDAGGTTTISGGEVNADVQTYNDDVVLGANTVLRGDALTAASTVFFGGRVNSDAVLTPRSLGVNASGLVTFSGTVGLGADDALGTADDRPLASLSAVGRSLSAQAVNTVATAGGNQSYTADNIALNGNLTGGGMLTLQPLDPLRSIVLGGALDDPGKFVLTATELGYLQNGFSGITIGRVNGQHDITIQEVTFFDPVTIQAPLGGAIAVNNITLANPGILGKDNASVTLKGSGGTTLNADIVTEGNAIQIDDSVVLGTPALITLDTTANAHPNGANVMLNRTVNDDAVGTSALEIKGGNNGLTTLAGAVGAVKAIKSLTTDAGGTTTLSGGEVNADVQTYNDDVVLGANTVLRGDALTAASTVFFGGKINSDGAGTPRTLDVNASGIVTFSGTVGLGADGALGGGDDRPLASLSAIGSSLSVQAVNTVATAGGNQSYTADNLALNGNLTGGGMLTLQPLDPLRSIVLGGALDDPGKFVLTATELGFLQNGFSGITIGRANGRHNIDIQEVTFFDPVTIQTPLGGSIAVNNLVLANPGILGRDNASVTLKGSGAGTTLNADIVTEGNAIQIDDSVVLGIPALVTLDTTANAHPNGANVTLNGTVNDDTIGTSALQIKGGNNGLTTLAGAVGALKAIQSLVTDAGGITRINGGEVNADVQTYNDNVVLGANTVLRRDALTAATTIHFGGKVDSSGDGAATSDNRNLTVNATTTDFNGTVGGNADGKLGILTTDAAGTTTLNASAVNGAKLDFQDDVVIKAATVTLNAPIVSFAKTVNSSGNGVISANNNLTVNATTTDFNGIVGGNADGRLGTLMTDAAGTTRINAVVTAGTVILADTANLNGGTVTTSAGQSYAAVTLGVATLLTSTAGGAINLVGAVTGNGFDLRVNTVGQTTFGGAVNGVGALTTDVGGNTIVNNPITAGSVNLADAATLNGGAVTTFAGQTYSTVGLGADTLLTSTAGGAINLAGTVTGNGFDLRVNTVGQTTFGGAVNGVDALSTDVGGNTKVNNPINAGSVSLADPADLNGGTITTSAGQTYSTVSLSADTVLTSTAGGAINLAGAVTGNGFDLRVNTAGQTTFGGPVNLVNALSTDAGGNAVVNNTINAGSVSLADAATLNGGTVTTSAGQSYAAMILGVDTMLSSTAGGAINLAGTVTGNGFDLGVKTVGQTTFGGTVNGVGALSTDVGGNTIVNNPITAVSVTLADPADLNGGTVTTSAGQTYSTVSLSADTILSSTAGGAINLAGAVTGNGFDLGVNTAGQTIFGGVNGVGALATDVGGNTVVNNPITAVSVTLADPANLNGGTVTTSAGQSYAAVTLGVNTILSSTAGGAINLGGLVTGNGFDLGVNTAGQTTFGGAVNGVGALATDVGGNTVVNNPITAVSVTLADPADLNGGTVTTSAGQSYAAVNLGADTLLTSAAGGAINLAGAVTGNNFDLRVNTAGQTTFAGPISGVDALSTDAGGNTVVNNPITAVSVSLADPADLNGGTVTTSAGQSYAAVNLGADTLLTSTAGGAINLAGAVTGNGFDLGVNTAGQTTFGGAVNGVDALSTDAGGNTVVNNPITAVSVSLADPADLNGGTVTTSAGQSYAAVTLSADTMLTSTAGGAINLAGAVTGNGFDLKVNTSGQTTFGGAVNGVDALMTDVGGNTTVNNTINVGSVSFADAADLNVSTVTTSAGQSYAAVTLSADTILSSTAGGAINLSGPVTGNGFDLRVNTGGQTIFAGALNGVDALSTDAGGNTVVNNPITAGSVSLADAADLNGGTVTTSAGQTYAAVNLGADTILSSTAGGAINLAGPVTGNGFDLKVNTSAQTTFGGAVNGVDALMTDAGGNTVVNNPITAGSVSLADAADLNGGTITTSGGQSYATVSLSADTLLTSTAGGAINLAGAVTGNGFDLGVNTAGQTTFGGAVNGVDALSTDAAGNTVVSSTINARTVNLQDSATLNGPPVNTTGDQTYTAVTLIGDTILTSTAGGAINLSTIFGNGHSLTINSSGQTLFGGVAANVDSLTVNAGDMISQTAGSTLTVNNLASFTSTGVGDSGNIILDQQNNFGSVGLSSTGNKVVLNEASSVRLDNVTVSGTLTVSSPGQISQVNGKTIGVNGDALFIAGAGQSISLGNAGNTFNGAVTFQGNGGSLQNITVSDTTDFDIQSGLQIGGTLDVRSGGNITAAGTVEADTFTGSAAGSIILGNPDRPGAPLSQPAHRFNRLGNVTAGGQFYFYDSDGGLLVDGIVTAPTVIVRTVGDLTLEPGAKITGTIGQTDLAAGILVGVNHFDVVLSAETPGVLDSAANFINNAGANSVEGRFIVFSNDPNLNGNPAANIGTTFVSFGGLTANFQAGNSTYASPGPVFGDRAFLFASSQAPLSDEAAKFFVDIVKVKPAARADLNANAEKEPDPEPPTIWTSSYHVYKEEKEEKERKKKGAKIAVQAEARSSVFALEK